MLKEIQQLLILQDRDRKLRALRQELKAAPLERKRLDEKLSTTTKQFEGSKLKGMELEVERKRLEVEAEAKRTQITKYQNQKFQTKKNEEFQALNNEISRLEREIREIEDRELDLMEASEQLKPQIAESEKAAQTAKTQVQQQLIDLENKGKALEAQIKEIEAERGKLAELVEEDLLDIYENLFKMKGEAVVALTHEVCTGCHMKVTASTNAKVRARREVVHCEQCGRILYDER